MTLEQVKQDIASGKSRMIYYSSRTLWWTHLDEDLKESSQKGMIAAAARHDAFMKRTDVSEAEKQRLNSLYKSASKVSTIPMDVTGATLFMTDKVHNWIKQAELKPEHFGRHGLEAFMKAHHQNCGGNAWPVWEYYNLLIDESK